MLLSSRMSTSTTVARICRKKISFLINTATETFKIPADRVAEFLAVLIEDLEAAQLIEDVSGKKRC